MGGSWLGCQVLPAISEVSILDLAANSGSSRMSRAPNLHSLSESNEVVYGKKTDIYLFDMYTYCLNNIIISSLILRLVIY